MPILGGHMDNVALSDLEVISEARLNASFTGSKAQTRRKPGAN